MRRFIQPFLVALGVCLLAVGCRQPEPVVEPAQPIVEIEEPASRPKPTTRPKQKPKIKVDVKPKVHVRFEQSKLSEADEEINEAIAEGKCPGGVLLFEHKGARVLRKYGNRAVLPAVEPMTTDTIFDMASLTKVAATAPAILKLIEQGKLSLADKVQKHIPEFTGGGKEEVTVRQLVAHTSGLRAGLGRRPEWRGAPKAIEFTCGEKLQTPPDTKFKYSDINYILLGEIVRRVSGLDLHEFTQRELYGPMKMSDTGFLPDAELKSRVAPTEKLKDGTILRGVVHDPTSRRMEGIAGHAGLFSTAADLAKYARMILNNGTLDGVQIFKPESIKLMVKWQTPNSIDEVRGLGWDIDTAYSSPRGRLFPGGSFGHTGWTGTCIWIDPYSRSFVIFLSNRNHPKGGSVVPLRKRISTLLAESIPNGSNYFSASSYLPNFPVKETLASKKVLNGVDVLKRRNFAPLKGLKVGLITNHTGQDRKGDKTIDLLHRSPEVELVALFSPEHGIRGEKDEKIDDGKDAATGLPVYSLYGTRREPAPEQLVGLDALVFDIQDIGCRFYTYISTMGNCMKVAGKAGLKFFVLDRVNPINGAAVQGPVRAGEEEFLFKYRFVAFHDIPLRHGMTVGELAHMFNEEKNYGVDLTVIELQGWKRHMWFEDTELPWKNPSPNMRDMTAAALYPGVGIVEFTVSVGRGTPKPFHVIGAPYVNAQQLAKTLNLANLAGVKFEPVTFTPDSSRFKNETCQGVRLILTDRQSLNAADLGITVTSAFQKHYPGKIDLEKVNRLLHHPETIEAIRAGNSLGEIKSLWMRDRNEFLKRRRKFLIY